MSTWAMAPINKAEYYCTHLNNVHAFKKKCSERVPGIYFTGPSLQNVWEPLL